MTRSHLIWLHKSQVELKEQFEFHPNLRFDDGVDAFSQSLDYWPYMESETEQMERVQTEVDYLEAALGVLPAITRREKTFDEKAFLSQLNATGYRQRIGRN